MERKKLILNCDPGTDDSLCIIMALNHPGVELLAITAESGNLPAGKSAANALRILDFMERSDIPVAKGMEHPLVRAYPKDPYSHGKDGLGNHFFPESSQKLDERHAASMIIDQVMQYPGEITILSTAPLTNIALAFMLKPEIVSRICKVYHLGGAYGVTDYAFINATGDNPMSEWNVYVDPEAARIVYESGVELETIGLDIAFNPEWVNIHEDALEKLKKAGTKAANYALEIIDYVDKNNSVPGLFNNGPIDTVAMCTVICPELIKTKEIHVEIDTSDNQLTRGMTLWDRRNHFKWEHIPKIKTAFCFDSERYQRVFVEAITGLEFDSI